MSLADRFWKYAVVGMECWGWAAYTTSKGYGHIRLPDGRAGKAHRVSWELHYGPIPDGLFVCHTCDNPQCCNPAHLFLGTNADNAADREAKGRSARIDNAGRRYPGAQSTRTLQRRARFEREGGKTPYAKC